MASIALRIIVLLHASSPCMQNDGITGRFQQPPYSTCAPAKFTTFFDFPVSAAIIAPHKITQQSVSLPASDVPLNASIREG
jgi:hypothetical protein